jgi:hypothetical protein
VTPQRPGAALLAAHADAMVAHTKTAASAGRYQHYTTAGAREERAVHTPLAELRPILEPELEPDTVAAGRVLVCKTLVEPYAIVGTQSVAEDSSGTAF